MTEKLDTSNYVRVFALDTQMVFHAHPLEQLDWQSLASGPVLLLVVPQVSSEVDGRKRDGRLGQRARALNRLLEPSIDNGRPTTLAEKPVRVDLAYVAASAIDWSRLDDLERDNPDDRIVAQVLHALVDDPSRIEMMSFDSRPRAAARRHELRAHKPDESWLLDPEPSPTDRRVAELEKRVKLLQANEPELRVSVRLYDAPPLIRYQVPPLAAELVAIVADRVLAKNPRERTGGMFYDEIFTNRDYDSEYDDYAMELRDRDIPSLHLGVARQFSAYRIEVLLENSGVLAAEHVTVELRSGNARLHAAPYLVDLFGPPPPSTRRDLFAGTPNLSQQLSRPDRTSFALEDSEDPMVQVEYRCEDFRHGRTQTLSAVLELTEQTSEVAHVAIRVTANNMRGDIPANLIAPIVDREVELRDLIDFETLGFRGDPPMGDWMASLQQEDPELLAYYRNDGTERE